MLININNIADGKKNVKTYSNGQDDIERLKVRIDPELVENLGNFIDKKIQILENE